VKVSVSLLQIQDKIQHKATKTRLKRAYFTNFYVYTSVANTTTMNLRKFSAIFTVATLLSIAVPALALSPQEITFLNNAIDSITGLPTSWTKANVNAACTNPIWTGLSCNNNNIYAIELDNYNLVGTVPTSIDGLTALQTLNLANNSLSGDLPKVFALPAFVSMNLQFNRFNGTFPAALASMNKVHTL
jgi:hypothetical protein